MISQIDCVTEEECRQICDGVHQLREHWIAVIGDALPFFTLGASCYIDAAQKSEADYRRLAKKKNPILRTHFAELYKRLADVLQKGIGQPVGYDEKIALPGFHIFLYCEIFRYPLAGSHFDLPFKELQWKYQEVDFDHPLSFTLPIALPQSGAGMNCWDIHYNEGENISEEELQNLQEERGKKLIAYQLGKLVVHDGFSLHQIAPCEDMTATDERITLQGHGLLCDGTMYLYF